MFTVKDCVRSQVVKINPIEDFTVPGTDLVGQGRGIKVWFFTVVKYENIKGLRGFEVYGHKGDLRVEVARYKALWHFLVEKSGLSVE